LTRPQRVCTENSKVATYIYKNKTHIRYTRLNNKFPFPLSVLNLQLAYALSLVSFADFAKRSLAYAGCFRPAGQLANRHIGLPFRLVASRR
jgi:hypothetical protein